MTVWFNNYNPDKLSYEKRKQDHLHLALKEANFEGNNGLTKIKLIHEALPNLDWNDIDISTTILGKKVNTPFFVSGMTGGFDGASKINKRLARACSQRGWIMGVGSQRKQLISKDTYLEWENIKKEFPNVPLLGNLGMSQVINTPVEKIEELVHSLGAFAIMIHTNPLQECLQPEGTPYFKGWKEALKKLIKKLSIPVCIKETGCGFSESTLKSLCGLGLGAVDVSGYGGTHWGRIEGDRISSEDVRKEAARTFAHWGQSTLSSLLAAQKVSKKDFEIWSSGGLTNGLDAAKSLALGSSAVGFANLILRKAVKSEEDLINQMFLLEYELKIALFCTGNQSVKSLNQWEYA